MAFPPTDSCDIHALDGFYRNCHHLFENLVHWIPAFYSDWSLVHHCTTLVWHRILSDEKWPLIHPRVLPTQETRDAVTKAAGLDLAHWDPPTMGEALQDAVRGILETLPENSQATPRQVLIDRLSFVTPAILLFPQETNDTTPYNLHPMQAFSDLCCYTAKRLLRHETILALSNAAFRQQLEKLASLVPKKHMEYLPPNILQDDDYLSEPTPEWFDQIEEGALELTAEQDRGEYRFLDPAISISRAVVALSKAFGASPPFPVLHNCLQSYYAKKDPRYMPKSHIRIYRVGVGGAFTLYDPEVPSRSTSHGTPAYLPHTDAAASNFPPAKPPASEAPVAPAAPRPTAGPTQTPARPEAATPKLPGSASPPPSAAPPAKTSFGALTRFLNELRQRRTGTSESPTPQPPAAPAVKPPASPPQPGSGKPQQPQTGASRPPTPASTAPQPPSTPPAKVNGHGKMAPEVAPKKDKRAKDGRIHVRRTLIWPEDNLPGFPDDDSRK